MKYHEMLGDDDYGGEVTSSGCDNWWSKWQQVELQVMQPKRGERIGILKLRLSKPHSNSI